MVGVAGYGDLGRGQERCSGLAAKFTVAAVLLVASVEGPARDLTVTLPNREEGGASRLVSIDDILSVRRVDALTLSPDGRRFAVLLRQARPADNGYATSWFVGSTQNGPIVNVGYGGEVTVSVETTGQEFGNLSTGKGQWSPDGRWIVYTLRRDGQVQLWRSDAQSGRQERLTNNAADVQEFVWSEDGGSILFVVGETRAAQAGREKHLRDTGYNYNDDLNSVADFMQERIHLRSSGASTVWTLNLHDRRERVATDAELANFAELQKRQINASGRVAWMSKGRSTKLTSADHISSAWLDEVPGSSTQKRVTASVGPAGAVSSCSAVECSGQIERVWWSDDGRLVFFLRTEGLARSVRAIFAWSPSVGTVSTVFRSDDYLDHCSPGPKNELICVRETQSLPSHIAAIDCTTGRLRVVADLNPEFSRIRLGRVERFEWSTPSFAWNEPGGALAGAYEGRAYGQIYYPPDFDAAKKYPVFIEPYGSTGFESSLGHEHSYHVYAANGFVVLNTTFPGTDLDVLERLGPDLMKQLYSPELQFPHLSMYAESTLRGLDAAIARGFVDQSRVGIGGVSHGTFVPLYIVQKYDRFAAISISSPHWGPFQYYLTTRGLRQRRGAERGHTDDWLKLGPRAEQIWSGIDIAEHVDAVEAPILMQLADQETFMLLRFIRHLDDAAKPYDAYVFPHETHTKWQSAHVRSTMQRNLAWFRFWLQNDESAAVSGEEYIRWRQMKDELSRRTAKLGASASE